MAIEFRCANCGKLLRTGDDTAGRQAKCPSCGATTAIPTPAAGESAPPSPPPPPDGVEPPPAFPRSDQPPGEITPSTLELDAVFSRTWEIFKPNWGGCLAVVVIVWIINIAVSLVAGFIPILGQLISSLFSIWIGIGMALYFLKTARGQHAEIGEIFSGGPYFLKILLAAILIGLIVLGITLVCAGPLFVIGLLISQDAAFTLGVVGLVVAVIAVVYLMLVISQYYYLILDRNADVIDSLKLSRQLMEGNKLTLLAIGLLCSLIMLVAMIPCGLGLLAAIPYFTLMWPVIYLTVTGQPTADRI